MLLCIRCSGALLCGVVGPTGHVDGRLYGRCSMGCHSNWVNITLISTQKSRETMGQYSQRFCLSQNPTTATAEAPATVIDSNHQNIERKGAKDRVMTKYTFRVSHSICPSSSHGPGRVATYLSFSTIF